MKSTRFPLTQFLGGLSLTLSGLYAPTFAAESAWLDTAHPGFTLAPVTSIGSVSNTGLAFLSNGDMLLLTAQAYTGAGQTYAYGDGRVPGNNNDAALYLVPNIAGVLGTPKKIADMFEQPMGVAVGANDEIMVTDRDSIFSIPSLTPTNVSTNKKGVLAIPVPNEWHHWIFCPLYTNGTYYAPYSGTIAGGGPSSQDASSDASGAFLSWKSGGVGGLTKICGGLRSPNGSTFGPGGIILIADNQGSWMPSSSLNVMKPNSFQGYKQDPGFKPNFSQANYQTDSAATPYVPPAVWLLHSSEVGKDFGAGQSPSQPVYMSRGPYAGDFAIGDINQSGMGRMSLDPVDGKTGYNANYNGSITFFSGGLGGVSVNRMIMDPKEDAIYIGTMGSQNGNWPKAESQAFYKLTFNNTTVANTFEILRAKSRANGVEIEFSMPVDPTTAILANFAVKQWHMNRQPKYGGGVDVITAPAISGVQISNDHKRVFLNLGNSAGYDRVQVFTATNVKSETGAKALLFNRIWFTHNFQSTEAFNGTAITALRNMDRSIVDHIQSSIHSKVVDVNVDLSGAYTISLCKLNGAKIETQNAAAPSHFQFKVMSQGLYLLQVNQGDRNLIKAITF